jgi:hypothetical protein
VRIRPTTAAIPEPSQHFDTGSYQPFPHALRGSTF